MTIKLNNIYINNTSNISGPYSSSGPLKDNFDYIFKDFYDGEKTIEDCEIKNGIKCIDILFKKSNIKYKDIDLIIISDLSNQIAVSNYIMRNFRIPTLGVYSACASFCEELIIASNFLSNKNIRNIICFVSSNNLIAEKEFRNPIEYGMRKPSYSTFTATISSSFLISKNKSNIKIKTYTIGEVYDLDIKDTYNMGAVMTPACARSLYKHLKDLNIDSSYYDLIISGDLGEYGSKLFKEYMKINYNIILDNYVDAACNIYNKDDKRVYSGGSGPSCLPAFFSLKIMPLMKEGKIKRVLLLATGALHSKEMVNLKKSIPAITHVVGVEAC